MLLCVCVCLAGITFRWSPPPPPRKLKSKQGVNQSGSPATENKLLVDLRLRVIDSDSRREVKPLLKQSEMSLGKRIWTLCSPLNEK